MTNLQPLFIKEEVLKAVRSFFYDQEFHEVLTPTLNSALPLEPNLYAFSTKWTTASNTKNLYLSTSPESGIKKALAKGIGNSFSLGKCFRNLEGEGSLHTPEFLMLEWYRENADYKQIMKDLQELIIFVKNKVDMYMKLPVSSKISYQNLEIDLAGNWPIYSMPELFKKYADVDFYAILQDKTLYDVSSKKGYNVTNATWAELFDQIFVNEVESQLPKSPFFITDFPAGISPLCTVKKDNSNLVERFEFFIGGMELANGNSENTDSKYVKKLFENEKQYRVERGLFAPPIDEDFIKALEVMSTKKYAGIGLGLDRLAMIMANITDIRQMDLTYED